MDVEPMDTDEIDTDGIENLEGVEGGAEASLPTASLNNSQQELVKDNVKLAYYLASRYAGSGASEAELEDLTSIAILQLVKCAAKFDPERGVPFAGYAGNSIRGQLMTAKAKQSENDYLFPASLDEPLGAGDEDDDEPSRHDVMGDGKNPLAPLLSKENAAELRKIIDTFPERERKVLYGRYWGGKKGKGKDWRSLGADLGVSGMYVLQLHASALKRLAKKLAERGIEPMRESLLPGCTDEEMREDFFNLITQAFPKKK